MANVTFDQFKAQMTSESFDWETDEIRVILMQSSFTPNASTQATYSDISASEIATGGNYTAGGKILTGKTANTVATVRTLDADDAIWASSTITNARHAVVLKNATPGGSVSAASPLLFSYDFGVNKSSSNDNFTFAINSSGLVAISG